jgi:hypothetical protein
MAFETSCRASPNLLSRYFCTLSGRMRLSPLSARSHSSVCFAATARRSRTTVTLSSFRIFCRCSCPLRGLAGRSPGKPAWSRRSPSHRPLARQRFLMPEPQNFSHHRRPVHHHPASFLLSLGHRFTPSRDQRSCSDPGSLFPSLRDQKQVHFELTTQYPNPVG